MAKRVVLAMSGGVDSSVAAVLLKRQGYDVVGLFMRTGAHDSLQTGPHTVSLVDEPKANPPLSHDRHRGCCSALDAGDARRVADRLDIPFYALDFEREFDRIIDYFSDEYLAGRTPNPCVVCNNWLKFGQLWTFAQQLGADRIATGHYARIDDSRLLKAVDLDKDQSYVLHGIRREVLPRLLFPIGHLPKAEVRTLARESNLGVADKPDSVEICFVPDGDHAGLIRRRRPELATAGIIRDEAGTILGEHDGYERFTIGQRKGLGIATGSRRFVLYIIPESREVVVGDPERLLAPGLIASRINWLIDFPVEPLRCTAKIRYRHPGAAATVTATEDGGAHVAFDEPQTAITPGQAVVFYDGDRVLGGGWIEGATASSLPAFPTAVASPNMHHG
jgi:tRNA-specific 2-thiouridylase